MLAVPWGEDGRVSVLARNTPRRAALGTPLPSLPLQTVGLRPSVSPLSLRFPQVPVPSLGQSLCGPWTCIPPGSWACRFPPGSAGASVCPGVTTAPPEVSWRTRGLSSPGCLGRPRWSRCPRGFWHSHHVPGLLSGPRLPHSSWVWVRPSHRPPVPPRLLTPRMTSSLPVQLPGPSGLACVSFPCSPGRPRVVSSVPRRPGRTGSLPAPGLSQSSTARVFYRDSEALGATLAYGSRFGRSAPPEALGDAGRRSPSSRRDSARRALQVLPGDGPQGPPLGPRSLATGSFRNVAKINRFGSETFT